MKLGDANFVSSGTDQAKTVDATAGGVQLAAFPDNTTHVLISLETAEIRYTLDGSAPTATNGHILAAGEERVWPAAMASAAKFIRTGAVSGVLSVSHLKAV